MSTHSEMTKLELTHSRTNLSVKLLGTVVQAHTHERNDQKSEFSDNLF